jgi:histidine triad (HIT) family protein
VQKVGRAVVKAFSAPGLTIQQFNEAEGGQVVFHLHVHVIPRFAGVALKPPAGPMEDAKVLAENAAKISAALEAG